MSSAQIKTWIGGLKDTPLDVRDKAVILLGFAGAFWRSEIAGLDVDNLSFTDQGLVVSLWQSKTNQEGDIEQIAIPYGESPLSCPVTAARDWLSVSGIKQSALFRGLTKGHTVTDNRLSTKGIARIVKGLCETLGLDPSEYGGHSLRAGHVTTAINNGAPRHITKRQTRHKSDKVFDGY